MSVAPKGDVERVTSRMPGPDVPAGPSSDLVALVGADQRLVHLNPAGRALLGLTAEADVTHVRFQEFTADPAAFAEVLDAAARDLAWTGALTLTVRGAPLDVVLACAPGLGQDGHPSGFALVAHEAVPRSAEAEATRLRGLVDDVALVVWEADARTGEFTFVSAHAEALLGYPTARWLGDPAFLTSVVHPDDRAEVLRERAASTRTRDDYDLGYRAITASGRVLRLHEVVHVERDADGAPRRLRGFTVDTTERRASEEREHFLTRLEQRLQPLEDPEEIMALASQLLGEHVGADRCAYAQAEADENHFTMSGDHATGLPHLPGRFAMSAFGAGALEAMRAGRPWVVADSRADDRLSPADLAAYETTGIRAVICLPLLKAGRFVAAMAVHQATVRRWTAAEVDLVGVVVNRCWESLQRTHTTRELRDSEKRYRLLVERATDAIWMADRDLRFVEVNPAACVLLGHERDRVLGRRVADLLGAEHENRLRELLAEPSEAVVTEVRQVRRADGSTVALDLSIQTTPAGVQAIGRDVTARQRVEAERELLLQREHEIAETLQRSLLPRELPALERLAAAARYLPASAHARTGGDWYEALPVTDTVVALSVGDVVGKGPTAAAVMGQLRSALASYLLDGHSPAAALERLDAFARRTNGATGSTCACLTFDWSTGELCWAAAGHPPPLVVEARTPRFLSDATGPVLGTAGRKPYVEHGDVLTPGASIVLYTDGLVERRGALIDEGLDRLLAVVRDAHQQEPEVLVGTITGALLEGGQDDDVALVVVRHVPERLRRRAPAQGAELAVLRRHVAAWAEAAGLSPDLLGDLHLTLGEAAANAVEHAYPRGPGEFDYEVGRSASGGVDVRVRDRGRWRPEPADKGYRGRGMQIIRALGENVTFHHDDDGTTVDFHLPAPPVDERVPVAPAPAEPSTPAGLAVDETDASVRVFRLTGDLDVTGAEDLRGTLLERVRAAGGCRVDVDLTNLDYLSSSGIALLLEAAATAARAGATTTVIAAEGTPPARILTLSGLHGMSAVDDLAVRILTRRPES
ncbi:SpoIIE family protein phosphatase [Umezawaea beigongshangensis]|uniref:SpoIIE family protein phosphatase n=1 Tax=Umezawaea beigongshangensis TaxID=2780383 RepID=UPI001E3760D9|nr:SpoIIE family protein phosphatase [Umezawaea beigongshangensis]